MLLSEMLGVERGKKFQIEGYKGLEFSVNNNFDGKDKLYFRDPANHWWDVATPKMLFNIIDGAPANIIHLPPPLTDGAREQLRALYTLGYRYITRTISLTIEAHVAKPRRVMNEWTQGGLHAYVPYVSGGIYGLPIKNETEPYDIAKALGV